MAITIIYIILLIVSLVLMEVTRRRGKRRGLDMWNKGDVVWMSLSLLPVFATLVYLINIVWNFFLMVFRKKHWSVDGLFIADVSQDIIWTSKWFDVLLMLWFFAVFLVVLLGVFPTVLGLFLF